MARYTSIERPFILGNLSDIEEWALPPQAAVDPVDFHAPNGVARQRRGWRYVADAVNGNSGTYLTGVHRATFALAGVTRQVIVGYDGATSSPALWIAPDSGSSTRIVSLPSLTSGAHWAPRTVYRDELLVCCDDGFTPLVRYTGADDTAPSANTGMSYTANTSNLTPPSGTWSSSAQRGWFAQTPLGLYPPMAVRILEQASTTILSMEGVRASQTEGLTATIKVVHPIGFCYPQVPVYNAGALKMTSASATVTGTGTKWNTTGRLIASSGLDGLVFRDGLLFPDASAEYWGVAGLATVSNDTTISLSLSAVDSHADFVQYEVLRRCPYRDVTVRNESLFGTGAREYPNRVYAHPPGQILGLPPGFALPFDPTAYDYHRSTNPGNFRAYPIDVPSPFDSDHNVALLATRENVLVLKRGAVYGVYGDTYPDYSSILVTPGAGCLHRNAAQNLPRLGPVWAGEDGVMRWSGGVLELMRGRMLREWRSVVADWGGSTDALCVGEAYGYLFVSVLSDASSDGHRCYVMDSDTGAWTRYTNHQARAMHSSRLTGEGARLSWIHEPYAETRTDLRGRVMDSGPVGRWTGTARDADGTSPVFSAETPRALARTIGIYGQARMVGCAVVTNLYDTVDAASSMDVSSNHQGGEHADGSVATKALGTITSDTVDRPDATRFEVDRGGRLHSVTVTSDTTATTSVTMEVHQIVCSFEDEDTALV